MLPENESHVRCNGKFDGARSARCSQELKSKFPSSSVLDPPELGFSIQRVDDQHDLAILRSLDVGFDRWLYVLSNSPFPVAGTPLQMGDSDDYDLVAVDRI